MVSVVAQKKQSLLTGVIKDSISTVKSAHIINLNTKDGASSNDFGKFQVPVSIGDTLLISSVQHHLLYKVITVEHVQNKNITIYLSSKRHQLDEVLIKKNNLSGSLALDVKRKKQGPPEINAVTLGLPFAGQKKLSQIDRKLRTASSSSGGIPLDQILNVISGRMKKLHEEKKVVEENNDVDAMLKKVKHFLTSNFNIKEEDHYRFLYYCRADSLFNKSIINNELTLIKFLHLKSKDFYKAQKEVKTDE